jgi:D-alanine-D-alanine ligase
MQPVFSWTREGPLIEGKKVVIVTAGDSPEHAGAVVSARHAGEALQGLGLSVGQVDISGELPGQFGDHDFAFIAGHGWHGEDGKLQGYLETIKVPYTGSGVLASATAMYKPAANRLMESAGLRVPAWTVVDGSAPVGVEAKRIAGMLALPIFLKPSSGGGSLAATVVRDIGELECFLEGSLSQSIEYVASEYISGRDISIGILERKNGTVALPVLMTEYDRDFYDYEVKHNVELRRHSCPAPLPSRLEEELRTWSKTAFDVLGCRGVARVDFIIDDSGRAWFLEVNTVPGLSIQGNLATMARAAGLSYSELIYEIAMSAFGRPGYVP